MKSNTGYLGIGLLAAWLLLTALPASATSQTDGLWPSYISGYVYGRNLVRGPNGEPNVAEFAEDGTVIREIGEATGDLKDAYVISANAYNAYVQAYKDFTDNNENGIALGAYAIDRESYYATDFVTSNNEPVTNKPDLYSATKSVFVRNQRAISTPNTSPILFQSTTDQL